MSICKFRLKTKKIRITIRAVIINMLQSNFPVMYRTAKTAVKMVFDRVCNVIYWTNKQSETLVQIVCASTSCCCAMVINFAECFACLFPSNSGTSLSCWRGMAMQKRRLGRCGTFGWKKEGCRGDQSYVGRRLPAVLSHLLAFSVFLET